jgi:ubiquinone/menaquinone biosynthesis C-methylase UbiE
MDTAFSRYQDERIRHWDRVAEIPAGRRNWGRYYRKRLGEIYQQMIAPQQRVLEIGCGDCSLLTRLSPQPGLGIDFSFHMLRNVNSSPHQIEVLQADAHALPFKLSSSFEVVILSDLLNDVWDVQLVLENLRKFVNPRTRIIINSYSRVWEPFLKLADRLGLVRPNLVQNWLSVDDLVNLLDLTGYEVIRRWQEVLWPFDTPLIAAFFNRFLVKVWPFRHLALTNFLIARPQPTIPVSTPDLSVSVIIPARNEAGNIPELFNRMPRFGTSTEMIFVEGHSEDETYSVIEQEIRNHPGCSCVLLRQSGVGKGDAVRQGFEQASGEVLMILDADMTVPPEDLQRFYDVLYTGRGEFANGVRLVYPMQEEAMRYANLVGNKFFSLMFSWVLGQPIKDTLCGTKALFAVDYRKIASQRAFFGELDPFGDFDLLLGAAKFNMKITDIPIRYRERVYGSTNIRRWSDGSLLIRMLWRAAVKLKFI